MENRDGSLDGVALLAAADIAGAGCSAEKLAPLRTGCSGGPGLALLSSCDSRGQLDLVEVRPDGVELVRGALNRQLDLTWNPRVSIEVGDFNGDGLEDIVVVDGAKLWPYQAEVHSAGGARCE